MIWIGDTLVSPGEGGVYHERMLGGARVWDPSRSKLAALFYKWGEIELNSIMRVLYLGAAHGTTVSHVADYVEVVYAVEFAARPMKDLIEICKRRRNIIPLMVNAARPEEYAPLVEHVDLIYQDIAQPNQAEIAIRNCVYLKPGGTVIIMLKTRSVDFRKDPSDVFQETICSLTSSGLEVLKSVWLEPFHSDHAAIVCTKPGGRDRSGSV